MKIKKKSKAFTLTELLVVVVVIGVLSAVVLPKFSKVIETRRTTEAEELMASIRTEQEKRCALDKKYITGDIKQLNDIVKNPKNYTLELASTGINAKRKDKKYTLEMPSYADGRICCRGEACEGLNKNYPDCNNFSYELAPASCAGKVAPAEPATPSCDNSHKNGDVETKDCECGVSIATWSCGASTGYAWQLGPYSACAPKPDNESKECDAGYTGTQTRGAVCKNGAWTWGEWSGACKKETADEDGENNIDCSNITSKNWDWCCEKNPVSGCYKKCGDTIGGSTSHSTWRGESAGAGYAWQMLNDNCSSDSFSNATCKVHSDVGSAYCSDGKKWKCIQSSSAGGKPTLSTGDSTQNYNGIYYCAKYSSCDACEHKTTIPPGNNDVISGFVGK